MIIQELAGGSNEKLHLHSIIFITMFLQHNVLIDYLWVSHAPVSIQAAQIQTGLVVFLFSSFFCGEHHKGWGLTWEAWEVNVIQVQLHFYMKAILGEDLLPNSLMLPNPSFCNCRTEFISFWLLFWIHFQLWGLPGVSCHTVFFQCGSLFPPS